MKATIPRADAHIYMAHFLYETCPEDRKRGPSSIPGSTPGLAEFRTFYTSGT